MRISPTAFLWLNALGFQAVWWAWAWGAPTGQALWPALGSVLFLALHFAGTPDPRRDTLSVGLCVVVGFLFDTAMMQADWLRFASPNRAPFDGVQPLWMMALWTSLACTLHTSLGWLQRWPVGIYAVCAVMGWLSYEAADRLGALTLADSVGGVVALLVGVTGTILVFGSNIGAPSKVLAGVLAVLTSFAASYSAFSLKSPLSRASAIALVMRGRSSCFIK